MPSTVRLHRVFRCPPERLYAALTDPRAMVKWSPPHGYVAEMHECDSRVGGKYRMSFANLATGAAHAFGGTYVEMVPGKRLRYNDRFDDPGMPGAMEVTIDLKAVVCGTEMTLVQDGVPDVIPVEMCYLGWQQSLILLGMLVEAEVP
ncbi:MAG: SRPBCC family protein [Phycisphaerales bacterium]|nr:SRPBCC family protein [Phycisphaerales bacterium]